MQGLRFGRALMGLAVAVAASPAFGFSYSEGANGDLSGDRLNPTNLGTLLGGSNTLSVTSVANDREYFRLNVPVGFSMTAMNLTAYSGNSISFAAIQTGTVFTETHTAPNVANLLGWTHFGKAPNAPGLGGDMLGLLGTGAGSIGFSPPLGAGDYVFWAQETGGTAVNYSFDFVGVPAPSVASLLIGVAGLGLTRRRRH